MRQLPRSLGQAGPSGVVNVTLDPARHDFRIAVVALSVFDQRRNQQ
jgi:hypothetical protein